MLASARRETRALANTQRLGRHSSLDSAQNALCCAAVFVMRRCVFISSSALVVLLAGCPKLTIGDGTSGGDSSSAESGNPNDDSIDFSTESCRHVTTCPRSCCSSHREDLPRQRPTPVPAARHISPCDFQLIVAALSVTLSGTRDVPGHRRSLRQPTTIFSKAPSTSRSQTRRAPPARAHST